MRARRAPRALQKAEREAADALATNSTALDALRAELEAAKTQGDEALEAARREGAEALETARARRGRARGRPAKASEAPTDDRGARGPARRARRGARGGARRPARGPRAAVAAAREEAAEARRGRAGRGA